MALSSVVKKNIYTGTDLVSTYNYSFKVFANTELLVKVRLISSGAETTLTLTTDYTVTGVGEDVGGTIVLVNASQAWLTGGFLKDEYKIVIKRVRPLTQQTAIKNQGTYYPEKHENEFDKLVMQDLQQQEELDRSFKLPVSIDPAEFNPELPATALDNPNAYLVINSSGTGLAITTTSPASGTNVVTGSKSNPQLIVAGTGVAFTGTSTFNTWYISGSGGAVTVTANPRIAAATNVGQKLKLVGCSDANYVELADSNGIVTGGLTLRLGLNSVVVFESDENLVWVIESTNGLIP